MISIFYHDRIMLNLDVILDVIESAIAKLTCGDAKKAVDALNEVRDLTETAYEFSKHAEHIWNDCARDIGQAGPMGEALINPLTGKPYTHVDQWAARYELIRREIVRRLDGGYSIMLVEPTRSVTSSEKE